MTDFDKLLKDIIDNPDKINDLTENELNEVQKKLVPYETVLSPDDKRIFAMSYTNLREDYLHKFTLTSMVAFMYRRMKEFTIVPHEPPESRANEVAREIIRDFLSSMFEYDPDKHVQECGRPPKTEKDIETAKKVMEEYRLVDEGDLTKVAGSATIPNDTFAWFRMYQKDNFEQLRWATMILYGVLPDLELMIQPCEVFDNMDEYKVYEHMHRDALQYPLTAISFGKWNILGPFQKNKDKMSFLNKNTEILAQILEQHKKDELIGADLMKRRIKERKKENIRRDGPDSETLGDHLKNMPNETAGTITLTKEEKEALIKEAQKPDKTIDTNAFDKLIPEKQKPEPPKTKNDYNDDHNPPDDAIAVNVFKTDKKKGLQKSHFFTEAVDPDEENKLNEARVKEIKKVEDEERKRRAAAEKKVKAKINKKR